MEKNSFDPGSRYFALAVKSLLISLVLLDSANYALAAVSKLPLA